MRDRYKIINEAGVYFLTSTVVKWLPVFTYKVYFEIIIRSFKYCIDHHHMKLYAFVILDNHFHLIASAANDNLSKTLASIRKFTAHEIIEQLQTDNRDWLLNQLTYYKKQFKKNSQYQVWQEGMHPVLM